jgi:trafficking protein particle complex subunit 11
MEAFPEDYVEHNLPLIFLSGIGHDEQAALETTGRSGNLLKEGGFKIRTDLPPLTDSAAENVLQAFLNFDSANDAINSAGASTRENPGAFKIKRVGRVGQTPHGRDNL